MKKAMSTKATGMFAAGVAALAELAPETTELWQTKRRIGGAGEENTDMLWSLKDLSVY